MAGTIQKQSIRSFIFSGLGVVLGFITTGLLLPGYFLKEEIGLMNLLVRICNIASTLSLLGFSTVRFFPYFKNKDTQHNGFLTLILLFGSFSSAIFSVIYLLVRGEIIQSNQETSPLLSEYEFYMLPMTIAFIFFILLDHYCRVLYYGSVGIVFREFHQRLLIMAITIIYIYANIEFSSYLFLYISSMIAPTLFIIIYLVAKREFLVRPPNLSLITKNLGKEIIYVSVFGWIASLSTYIVLGVDSIMINYYLGLADTGVYTIAAFFGSLITMPGRMLNNTTNIYISEAFKENNLEKIGNIYAKSCSVQFVFAVFLFTGIISNMDLVNVILPDYTEGNLVIFFLGLAGVTEMMIGVNTHIINLSPYYKFSTYFMIVLILIIIFGNVIFIPVYGIWGAAMATCIATVVYSAAKYILLAVKYRYSPLTWKYFVTAVVAAAMVIASVYIDIPAAPVWAFLVKSSIITAVYLPFIYLLKISPDVNLLIEKALRIIRLKA